MGARIAKPIKSVCLTARSVPAESAPALDVDVRSRDKPKAKQSAYDKLKNAIHSLQERDKKAKLKSGLSKEKAKVSDKLKFASKADRSFLFGGEKNKAGAGKGKLLAKVVKAAPKAVVTSAAALEKLALPAPQGLEVRGASVPAPPPALAG
eukprot:tig00021038_g17517.t1